MVRTFRCSGHKRGFSATWRWWPRTANTLCVIVSAFKTKKIFLVHGTPKMILSAQCAVKWVTSKWTINQLSFYGLQNAHSFPCVLQFTDHLQMGPKAALFYIKSFTLLLTLSYFYKHYKDKLIQLASLNPLVGHFGPQAACLTPMAWGNNRNQSHWCLWGIFGQDFTSNEPLMNHLFKKKKASVFPQELLQVC